MLSIFILMIAVGVGSGQKGPPPTITLTFTGNRAFSEEQLRSPGDVFNKQLLIESLKIINATGQFETIDPDKDVEYKGDDENSSIELVVRLKKKSLKGP